MSDTDYINVVNEANYRKLSLNRLLLEKIKLKLPDSMVGDTKPRGRRPNASKKTETEERNS